MRAAEHIYLMKRYHIFLASLVFLTSCTFLNPVPVNVTQYDAPWMTPRSNYPEELLNQSAVVEYAQGRLLGCQIAENKITVKSEETGWSVRCQGRTMSEHHIDQQGVWVKQSELVGNPYS